MAKFCSKCGTRLKTKLPGEDSEATTILQPEIGSKSDWSDDSARTSVQPMTEKPSASRKPPTPQNSFTGQAAQEHFGQQKPFIPSGAYGTSAITEADLPERFRPLSAWAYFGYSLLFGVVPFGWIVAIVFAVGKTENVNLRNFARSFFCYLVVVVILAFLIFGVAGCSLGAMMYSL